MSLLITLVRHGETDWNAAGRIQGHEDIGLNAVGLAQADQLAQRLAREQFDAVVSSDLQRTRQTVAPLLARQPVPVSYDAQWRERNFGRLQGMRRADMEQSAPEFLPLLARRDLDADFGGGESLLVFSERCVDALNALIARYGTGHVLVVCHGGVLDCVYRHAAGLSLEVPRPVGLRNAAINQLRSVGGPDRLEVVCWDDTSHLDSARDETDK